MDVWLEAETKLVIMLDKNINAYIKYVVSLKNHQKFEKLAQILLLKLLILGYNTENF